MRIFALVNITLFVTHFLWDQNGLKCKGSTGIKKNGFSSGIKISLKICVPFSRVITSSFECRHTQKPLDLTATHIYRRSPRDNENKEKQITM